MVTKTVNNTYSKQTYIATAWLQSSTFCTSQKKKNQISEEILLLILSLHTTRIKEQILIINNMCTNRKCNMRQIRFSWMIMIEKTGLLL